MSRAILHVVDFGLYPNLAQDQTAALIAALGHLGRTVKGIEYALEFRLPPGKYCLDWATVFASLSELGEVILRRSDAGI
jgi:hypothetical protein